MKAFLLAAGYATRMYPLTRDRAKPLLEVGGEPILSHLVKRVVALPNVSEIVVIGNERFASDFEAWGRALDCPVPLRILNDGSTDDSNKLGAVGDLAFALEQVTVGEEDWLVAAADNLLGFDLAPLHARYLERREPMLTLREVVLEPGPSRYNEVTLGEDQRVARFREKPDDPQSNLAAIALYFFGPEVAGLLPRYLAEGGNPDAPGHFIAWLVEQVPVRAVPMEGEWFDIGNLETLEQARARFSPT